VADVVSFEMKNRHSSNGDLYDVQIEVRMRRDQRRDALFEYLRDFDDVTIFSEE
jgi:putative Mg2+ transporter-C (MgtC) family protein